MNKITIRLQPGAKWIGDWRNNVPISVRRILWDIRRKGGLIDIEEEYLQYLSEDFYFRIEGVTPEETKELSESNNSEKKKVKVESELKSEEVAETIPHSEVKEESKPKTKGKTTKKSTR